ncbi:uncharacterized protein KY384_006346 [Bacidia gigantensis]|uniref:uncharacterized protein n=1 Tax=Bacidia gigantensis TaxID=2732470 RepID=UPI001D03E6B7|nr:uncharacterized protein KY384_006346 [Bacidia gigantensis]KAG8528659.1 hypothetical protein KY384_006346 [Bacidia gigantensis]
MTTTPPSRHPSMTSTGIHTPPNTDMDVTSLQNHITALQADKAELEARLREETFRYNALKDAVNQLRPRFEQMSNDRFEHTSLPEGSMSSSLEHRGEERHALGTAIETMEKLLDEKNMKIEKLEIENKVLREANEGRDTGRN